MGEVYRAVDTNLKRAVAIKVLPSSVAGDTDRLARFQREAEVLAALNHPNIAAIYGLEHGEGGTALVMELVDGPTLADRIAQGPIPLDEALAIATQVADALEAAHEQGIVHRDLKPANIKVRPDGTVKVLDFGLAKALDPTGVAGADVTAAPTITTPAMTRAGTILGTAAYMSPEQARGRPVDKRTDIWAFGCVLFEMLTGRRAFEGEDVAEVLGAVIHKPVEWDRLPARMPGSVRAVLERCLEKDPKRRIRDIGDVQLALQGAFGATPSPAGATSGVATSARTLSWRTPAAALAAALVSGAGAWVARTPSPAETVAFTVDTPVGDPASFALSPDGRQLVHLQNDNGVQKLWLRPLGSTAARVIPGTERSSVPFWSPDSRKVAYFTPDGLQKVDLAGGAPKVIAKVRTSLPVGGAWNNTDVILFADVGAARGIFRVAATGGEPQLVTELEANENYHAWPEFLPDGRHFLYVRGTPGQRGTLVWRALDSSDERVVRPMVSKAWYSPSGHVVFHNDGPIVAQRFDAASGTVAGDVIQVAGATWSSARLRPALALSPAGVLAHRADDGRGGAVGQLSWVDRQGKVLGVVGPPANYINVALDRAGNRIVANTGEGARDVWILDVRRGTRSRLTFDPADDSDPVFSPDGRSIVFYSARNPPGIYRKAASGAGADELVAATGLQTRPLDWSPDGRFVSFRRTNDLWILLLEGDSPVPRHAGRGTGRILFSRRTLDGVLVERNRPLRSVRAGLSNRAGGRTAANCSTRAPTGNSCR